MKKSDKNIIIVMCALFGLFIGFLMFGSCSNSNQSQDIECAAKSEKFKTTVDTAKLLTEYKIEGRYGGSTTIYKLLIDGHEYYMFSSKLANPPTIVHCEACPCKQKTL